MLQQTKLENLMLDLLVDKPKKDYEKAFNSFLKGEKVKHGKYFALGNALVYRCISTENQGTKQTVLQDIIARKINNIILGNASILPLIGRRVAFGNIRENNDETDIQRLMSDKLSMLPFNVFEEAGLSLEKLEIIDKSGEETINRRFDNPDYDYKKKDSPEYIFKDTHFTGASLYKIEDNYFLFDIDRNEIKHGIFNPFLVKLSKEVKTIKEAYESLKPIEVIEAEKQKLKVVRQGEWFFIPVELDEDNIPIKLDRSGREMRYILQAGNNRPNYAEHGTEIDGKTYVTGKVSHSGREHKDIKLVGWHRVIPNTAIESFTIEGDID